MLGNNEARLYISKRISESIREPHEVKSGTWKTWQTAGHPAAEYLDNFVWGKLPHKTGSAERLYTRQALDAFFDWLRTVMTRDASGNLVLSRRVLKDAEHRQLSDNDRVLRG